ncbi:Sgf11 [Abeliophyllum distichum]|uniref:SAGA-associated factor 11 n=1 Tax=Abeliophyllum distichum TaxID=126358 RepID=A0ABD1Q2A8_9LAMI
MVLIFGHEVETGGVLGCGGLWWFLLAEPARYSTPVESFQRVHNLTKLCVSLILIMSTPADDNVSSNSQLSSDLFGDLLDSIIVDVASEAHRIARLGLDRNLDEEEVELRLSAEARARASDPSHSGEANGKYVVDIFGQTHPPVANEILECMNCGRSIMAGRFAPHLEKCMGKGRKARLKATRSSSAAQNRYSRGSPLSTHSPYSNSTGPNRSNGSSGVAGDENSCGTLREL